MLHADVQTADTDLVYLIVPNAWWTELPAERQLSCARVKFTTERVVFNGPAYLYKAEALIHLTKDTRLVREQHLINQGPHKWLYHLLV